MRHLLRYAAVGVLVLAGWAAPPTLVHAASLDTTADRVFGQPDFAQNTTNNGGLSASSLYNLGGMALDTQGNLYVADYLNSRVLEYDAPLTTHAAASRVFGQPDFTQNAANNGGVSATSLNYPTGVALDAQNNLYVADQANARVVEYDAPFTHDTTADRVFGQPDFITNAANNGGVSATSLNGPVGVALDAQGNLYVADRYNNRVLEFGTPLTSGKAASRVFGQSAFTTNTTNNGGVSASSLDNPESVGLDAQGNLYVADSYNSRVLEYNAPLTTDGTADHVFGQPDFASNAGNNGGVSATSLDFPGGVALNAQGDMYVADANNSRVLEYSIPLSSAMAASQVFGQPDFTQNTANNGGINATSLSTPVNVALDTLGNLYVADYGNSRALEYDLPVPHGVPAVAALSPSSVAKGSPAFTLTVGGTGFVPGSVVRWNGSSRPTTFLSGGQLNAAVSADDISSGGPFTVTVFTPAPGGGTSNPINLSGYTRAGHDATADLVLGQSNFTTDDSNSPVMRPGNRLSFPAGVAVDAHSGRLFVADTNNNRVLSWPNAAALANAQSADLVLGQPNLAETLPNNGGVSALSLHSPVGVAVDGQGNLYVGDFDNHRVLEYADPLTHDTTADRVFGQPDFTHNAYHTNALSAASLDFPFGMAVSSQGNLYVADEFNSRVLEYDAPLTSDASADRVFGQPSFITNTANYGGVSATSLYSPSGVAVDKQGNLYVADTSNSRVLEYDTPLTQDTTADRVFGQPDFTHNTQNLTGLNADSLRGPRNVALDAFGNLYVADEFNNRVLEYDAPLTHDARADRVFGQPTFYLNAPNQGGSPSASSLDNPIAVALDAQNNLYVVDFYNQRVLEYDWAALRLALPVVLR